jgi:hypothetical protein
MSLDWQFRVMLSDRVSTVGLAAELTMMIISRQH